MISFDYITKLVGINFYESHMGVAEFLTRHINLCVAVDPITIAQLDFFDFSKPK